MFRSINNHHLATNTKSQSKMKLYIYAIRSHEFTVIIKIFQWYESIKIGKEVYNLVRGCRFVKVCMGKNYNIGL